MKIISRTMRVVLPISFLALLVFLWGRLLVNIIEHPLRALMLFIAIIVVPSIAISLLMMAFGYLVSRNPKRQGRF